MRRFILFFCFIAIVCQVRAIDPKTQMNEAKEFYSKGDYQKAIETYQSVLSAGYASVGLYYNLGNSYFKVHNIKSAILYYEKAKLLDPSDDDIEYNLELARSFTVDKIENMNELFFITWIKGLRNLLSANSWALLSIITFVITLASFLLYLLSGRLVVRKTGFTIGVIVFFITLISFSMGYQLRNAQTSKNTAIIFTPTVTIKSTPAESGNNLFVLHEGAKVEILNELRDLTKTDWCEIRISDGNRGWVRKQDLETI